MIVLVDNYDSFTWNVYQLLSEQGATVEVLRNDAASVDEVLATRPAGIVVSPGPGDPAGAGISTELIRAAGRVPVLGICLGMQCIAAAFGGEVTRAGELVHGKASSVDHDGAGVFAGLPQGFAAGRYHSLAVPEHTLPSDLVVTARTRTRAGDGRLVMGVRHTTRPVEGVQFHPESILTPHGAQLLGNFVQVVRAPRGEAA